MSSHTERKICRLCLQRCDKYEIIVGVTRQILNSLLLKLNLDVSDGPVMCDNCAFNLKQSFRFKSMVGVFTPIIKLEDDAALDLREPFINEEDNQNSQESRTVCGICMNSVKTGFFIPLDDLEEEAIFQRIMLEECLPDLNLNTTKNPVICTACNKSLKSHYNFVTECKSIEENIKLYCETNGISDGKISLSNVRKFKYEGMFCAEDNYLVEEEHCNDQENQNEEIEMEDKSIIELIQHEVISDTDAKFELDTGQQDSSEVKVAFPQLEFGVTLSTSGTISVLQSQEPHFERPKRNKNSQESSSVTTNHNSGKCSDKVGDKTNAKKRKIANEDIIETVTYRCQSCTFTTEHEDSLTQHMPTHTKKIVRYRCESCPFETKYTDSFKRHALVHEDPSKVTMYPCKHCSYRSKYKAGTMRHMKSCKRRKKRNKVIKKHPAKKISSEVKVAFPQLEFGVPLSTSGTISVLQSQEPYFERLKRKKNSQENSSVTTNHNSEICLDKVEDKTNAKKRKTANEEIIETVKYRCQSCTFITEHEDSLMQHMLTHTKKIVRYRCESCPFETKYTDSFKRHALVHEDPSKVTMYPCKHCSYRSKYKAGTMRHMKGCKCRNKRNKVIKKHPAKKISSEIKVAFPQPEGGVTLSTGGTISMLQSQEPHFERPKRKKNSQESSSVTTNHNSEKCSDKVEDKTNAKELKTANEDIIGTVTYKCQSCTFKTEHDDSLTQHMPTHTKKIVRYRCESCPFETKYTESFKRHALVHEDPSEVTMYPCKHCSYRSKYEAGTKRHMKSCKRRKKRDKVIKKHPAREIRYAGQSHLSQTKSRRGPKRRAILKDGPNLKKSKDKWINPSGIKLYKCNSCSFQSKYKANLQRHELFLHILEDAETQDTNLSGIKWYKCNSCSYQSRYRQNLQRHELVHCTPKDLYKCNFCFFKSKYKENLQRHALIHCMPKDANFSKIKLYKCNSCSFRSRYKKNLRRHELSHQTSEDADSGCTPFVN